MEKNNVSNNVNNFMSIVKLVIFVIVVGFVLSLAASVLSWFKSSSIDGQEKLKEDYEEFVETGVINPEPWDPSIPEKMNNGQVIADIYSDLFVFEYDDVVVFVKNASGSSSDMYSHNIVFRKTDKGLVMDGMFLHYDKMGYTLPSVSNFLSRSTSDLYPTYNNYNFMSNWIWTSAIYSQSCFSFNNNVSSAIMFNRTFVGSLFNGIRNICSTLSSVIDYSKCYEVVNKYCIKDIFAEFTSFGENQHIMYSSLDEFSDFWTDIYNSIKTLNKNCLVNYTGCHVGLYAGDPSSDNCKYFNASSYFKVKYQKIGHKAYSVDTKNYTEGHEFNCENKATAIPEITFELIQDTVNSTGDYTKLRLHLLKNRYTLTNSLEIYESSLNSANVYNVGFDNFAKYMNFGSCSAHIESVITQDGKEIENDIVSFEDVSFVVDNEVSKINMYYTINIPDSNPTNPDTSTDPTNPDTSTDPTNPDTSTDPTNPDTSTDPDNPDNPDTSTDPDNPDTSTDPDNPDTSTDPTNPDTSTDPDNPGETEKPNNPDEEGPNVIKYYVNGDLFKSVDYEAGSTTNLLTKQDIFNDLTPDKKINAYIFYGWFMESPTGDLKQLNGITEISETQTGTFTLYGRYFRVRATGEEGYSDATIQINVTQDDEVTDSDGWSIVEVEYYDEELGYTRINSYKLTSNGLTISGLKYANMIIRIKTTIKIEVDCDCITVETKYNSTTIVNVIMVKGNYSGIVGVGVI